MHYGAIWIKLLDFMIFFKKQVQNRVQHMKTVCINFPIYLDILTHVMVLIWVVLGNVSHPNAVFVYQIQVGPKLFFGF